MVLTNKFQEKIRPTFKILCTHSPTRIYQLSNHSKREVGFYTNYLCLYFFKVQALSKNKDL